MIRHGLAGLLLVGVSALGLSGCDPLNQAGTQTVTAEAYTCQSPKNADPNLAGCEKYDTWATYEVTLSLGAGSCGVLTRYSPDKPGEIGKGRLTFVDNDNWQCDVNIYRDSLFRYALTDGRFSLVSVINGTSMPVEIEHERYERTDTLKGQFDHALRWLHTP
jgi:hypothetical protein